MPTGFLVKHVLHGGKRVTWWANPFASATASTEPNRTTAVLAVILVLSPAAISKLNTRIAP